MSAINKAIKQLGASHIGRECGRSGEAVRKWGVKGCLPRTDYTGETNYAKIISGMDGCDFTVKQLLARPKEGVAS